MPLSRRDLLRSTGAGAAAAAIAGVAAHEVEASALAWDDELAPFFAGDEPPEVGGVPLPDEAELSPDPEPVGPPDGWEDVRAQFRLAPGAIHMAGLLIASHPRPVRDAIERHRQAMDANPAQYLQQNNRRLQAEVRREAGAYLGARPQDIAFTDSTTMGLGLVYNGIRVRSGQELLTSTSDYYSSHEALRFKAHRAGVPLRKITLYRSLRTVSEEEIVKTLIGAVRPQTRVVAVTWVHSSTGLKIPVGRIARELARINANRSPADRALLCVDGVHGFGVENVTMEELGCDFFMAGTHKWLFGPRGSGIIWGHPRSQDAVTPTIPSFTRRSGWGGQMSPGGFKPFEHLWSLGAAFRFHRQLGKARVTERIHGLSRQLKEGLAPMSHVILYTPLSERLSAGITCFDIRGMSPPEVVQRLRQRQIIASVTPYEPHYVRLTPGIFNTAAEVEQVLRVIRTLA